PAGRRGTAWSARWTRSRSRRLRSRRAGSGLAGRGVQHAALDRAGGGPAAGPLPPGAVSPAEGRSSTVSQPDPITLTSPGLRFEPDGSFRFTWVTVAPGG